MITHQTNHLHLPLLKLIFQFGERTQLGGTNGSEVGRMGEQDSP
jgi:hypothetical protein